MIHLLIRHKMISGKNLECLPVIEQCVRIWQRAGATVLGAWTNWIGGETDEIMYIFQFKDFDEYMKYDTIAHKDPEWLDFLDKLGTVTFERQTELLRPTAFSPLK